MITISRRSLIAAASALALAHGAGAQDESTAYVVAYIEVSPSSVQQALELIHIQLDIGAHAGGYSSDAVYALTHVDVPPDNVEPTREHLHSIAGDSRAEPGNRRFDVVVQSSRSNHFTVVEKWQSAQAQTEHVDAPHSREFRDNLYPLSGALYDERLYRALN